MASCHLRLPEPGLRLGPVDSALSRYNVKPGTGTTVLVAALFVVFGIELASRSVGNETLLLKLGALPDDGELHGEYWRLATYSFLHLNGTHLLVNECCYCGSDGSSRFGPFLLALTRSTFPACFALQQ